MRKGVDRACEKMSAKVCEKWRDTGVLIRECR